MDRWAALANLAKSLLHNVGVVLVGLLLALACSRLDLLLGLPRLASVPAAAAGAALASAGFLLRTWAAFHFYRLRMRVIALEPQGALVVSGPFRFSRNPLYLGGNVFIFFGEALLLGSPAALVLTAAHLPLMDLMVRREERQLERRFGEAWRRYRGRTRRWL